MIVYASISLNIIIVKNLDTVFIKVLILKLTNLRQYDIVYHIENYLKHESFGDNQYTYPDFIVNHTWT